MTKTIEINPRKREVSKVTYSVDVATDYPDRLKNRLEAFEVLLRDVTPLDESSHHRLTLSVVETPHVSAETRLDAVFSVLADVVGLVELGRRRLDDADVRKIPFQLDVEARFIAYDVERHLRLATGIIVLQVRDLPAGDHACLKCNSEDLKDTGIPDRRNGGSSVRCESCGFVGSLERRPRGRILLKVSESAGVTAEERLEAPLSIIRSARHFVLLDVKRLDPDGQADGIPVEPVPSDDLGEVATAAE